MAACIACRIGRSTTDYLAAIANHLTHNGRWETLADNTKNAVIAAIQPQVGVSVTLPEAAIDEETSANLEAYQGALSQRGDCEPVHRYRALRVMGFPWAEIRPEFAMARFCSECGVPAQAGAKYCHACGASLGGKSEPAFSFPSPDQIMQHSGFMKGGWLALILGVPIGLGIAAFVYSDFQQYTLTAAYMAPSALVSYVPLYWMAKLMMRRFRVPFMAHLLLIALACIFSPLLAVWFIERPIELMETPVKSFLIAAGCTLVVIGIAQDIVKDAKA